MSYIDGFIIAVPTANKDQYRELAAKVAPIYLECGASRVVENWGDDVPKGKVTDFYGAVKAEEKETVVFSWVEWPSKEVRDTGNKKFMEHPMMKEMESTTKRVFDGMRMIYGGFSPIVELAAKK
jgi:uncharacterized protein YbaA (DUF1428 family)